MDSPAMGLEQGQLLGRVDLEERSDSSPLGFEEGPLGVIEEGPLEEVQFGCDVGVHAPIISDALQKTQGPSTNRSLGLYSLGDLSLPREVLNRSQSGMIALQRASIARQEC